MKSNGRIITIGLSPAWDVSCRGRDLDWGRHPEIDEQVVRPAGKALNVSSALAWMGHASVAAGLWGREDSEQMRRSVCGQGELVRVKMTLVDGPTRRNITVVDTLNRREMHLRQKSRLATSASLAYLSADLRTLVRPDDVCVFAGAMPTGSLVELLVALVRACHDRQAPVVVDTHSQALRSLVDAGLPWLIAPNVEELAQLLGSEVKDTPAKLVAAARTLLEKVPTVLISRGARGAILVTKRGAWSGCATTRGKVLETVGCGDYLLAGFLAGYRQRHNARTALGTALKVATARAQGWTETHTWSRARGRIEVRVDPL